jgi:oligopeptide transport system substrate-binding protein
LARLALLDGRAAKCFGFLLALTLAACDESESGPVAISAIGGPPQLANPNRTQLDPPSALLVEATAQGLVRFEATGSIEPALAQRWIVSDDGLRYTFRLARARWSDGAKVTASQVVERLRAAASPASRNPLKPVLGAVAEIEAMTDEVLEISLKSPRPRFLELLAQPELGILHNGRGSGPLRATRRDDGSMSLARPERDEDEPDREKPGEIEAVIRGERVALAVARFQAGEADWVTGGTAGDLPIARAARPRGQTLQFDPVSGLFGLAFLHDRELLAEAEARDALNMAVDREALVGAFNVPGLQPRLSLLPLGIAELARPSGPGWAALPIAERRARAAGTIRRLFGDAAPVLRVALPRGHGHRLLFAHLRRDWRAIGIRAEAVQIDAAADLRLIDSVAPGPLASWYLRHFTCAATLLCSPEADAAMEEARNAPGLADRRARLVEADRLLVERVVFIPLAAPVRWHLVSARLTGFRPHAFGRRAIDQLIAPAGE